MMEQVVYENDYICIVECNNGTITFDKDSGYVISIQGKETYTNH